ncbi:MAG: hypothetical protein HY319_11670 [Armatimonadetes bacterium]|nr:hypothetical protein [Armatimonadota bacterium]
MKKVLLVFAGLVAVAVVLLIFRGGAGGGGLELSGNDARQVGDLTVDFLEDIQFKDFEKASSYHSAEDRKKVNIPKLIERLFAVKPEFLDIMRYELVKVDVDRSGNRARVKTHTVVKILNTGEIKEPDIIFYWYKDPAEGWVMELESSLHR